MLNLDPERAPVPPVDAATLILVRDGEDGLLEVFCVRRHGKSPFLGGAIVFPGGKLDPSDGLVSKTTGLAPRAALLARNDRPRVDTAAMFAAEEAYAHALAVCACRESLEEGGVLPTTPVVSGAILDRLRRELAEGAPLDHVLEGCGSLRLDTQALRPFGRWVTPEAEARRFDARFFLAAVPKGQLGAADDHETVAALWAPPLRMLEAFRNGEVFLAPPTLRALELLSDATTVDEAFALASRQSLLPICPRFVPGDPPLLAIPGDPLHDEPERRVDGPTRFVLREGRFVSEDP